MSVSNNRVTVHMSLAVLWQKLSVNVSEQTALDYWVHKLNVSATEKVGSLPGLLGVGTGSAGPILGWDQVPDLGLASLGVE